MEEIIPKAERTRRFIIETTASLFNKKGYAGTSMSDITAITGLTKGSIYGNFENKEDVALAVFDYNHSRIVREVNTRSAEAVTYRDKLMVYADVYDQYAKSWFPEGGCPILNTAIEADDTNSLLKDKAAGAVSSWYRNIQDIIEAGADAGEFRKDVDSLRLAISIVALIEGGIMISRITENMNAFHQVMQTVGNLLDQIII